MTSPLLLDQLAAQHRHDLLAEMRRPAVRTPRGAGRASSAARMLQALRSAGAAATTAPSPVRSGQVCCA